MKGLVIYLYHVQGNLQTFHITGRKPFCHTQDLLSFILTGISILQRLHVVELLVVAVEGEEFVVGAALYYSSFVKYTDFIGVADG